MMSAARQTLPSRRPPLAARAMLLGALFLLEIPFLAFLFDPLAINDSDAAWLAARDVLRQLVPSGLFFAVAFAVMLLPARARLAEEWTAAARGHRWRALLGANLLLFALTCAGTLALNRMSGPPPWIAFSAWLAAVAVMTGFLALAAAPSSFWRALAAERWGTALIAAGAAAFVTFLAALSQSSWNRLSLATFHVSAFILSLYERNVVALPDDRVLGADGFEVLIASACSGYEGIGMVIAFLSIYLWFFRKSLRFPNAFALLPAGVVIIWLLNAVRIAALISLGAHVSPDVALTGFHSQAGWMMFLIVTIALMAAAQRIAFFQAAGEAKHAASPAVREASSLLAPFLAIIAAGLLITAFTTEDGAATLYPVKAAAGAVAFLFFLKNYNFKRWKGSWEAAGLGLLVGVLWIATDPRRDAPPDEAFISTLSGSAAILWGAARIAGTVLVAPVAEELAFRGYLHRKLVAERFEDVPEAAFSWRAFLITSVLFGAIHERWLAGALSGAVFALALYRTGRIGGAITAHAIANLTIALYALAFGAWGLL